MTQTSDEKEEEHTQRIQQEAHNKVEDLQRSDRFRVKQKLPTEPGSSSGAIEGDTISASDNETDSAINENR